jgi:hypothetical protein
VDSLDSYGGTPLVAAALNGELECVQVLLDAGAEINHATANLNTPLMKAALNGHVACVRVLVGWRADVTKANNKGKTAVQLAVDALGDERESLKDSETTSCQTSCHSTKGSIQEKRQMETIKRLQKLIQDHESVIEDLTKSAECIRKDYGDLFEDSSMAF